LVDSELRLFAQTYAAARTRTAELKIEGINCRGRWVEHRRATLNWIVAYMAIVIAGGVAKRCCQLLAGGELAEDIHVGYRFVLADEQRAARVWQDSAIANCSFFNHDVCASSNGVTPRRRIIATNNRPAG
jgi:hypothetical protein